MSRKLTGWS